MPHYSDATYQQQNNGAQCDDDFDFVSAYKITGLNSFHNGGGSSFSQHPYGIPTSGNTTSTDVSIDHFANLLQAAATAGQQAAKAAEEQDEQDEQDEQEVRNQLQQHIEVNFGQQDEELSERPVFQGSFSSRRRKTRQSEDDDLFVAQDTDEEERPVSQGSTTSKTRKRKRHEDYRTDDFGEIDEDARPVSQGSTSSKIRKRKRRQSLPKPRKETPPMEEVDALLREDAMWGAPEDESEDNTQEYDDAAIAASTKGVAIAAALFKQPTEKSKNYSRKSMYLYLMNTANLM